MATKLNNLSYAQFHDPDAARSYLERLMWPHGPVCPHCGVIGEHYQMKGKSTRPGLWKCKACRKPFTVTVGTVFEKSHIPLNKWLFAVYLMASSKKGISSHQLHRTIGVTYQTAWFMTHRIREAMADPAFTSALGGGGGVVEADETYWGHDPRRRMTRGASHKQKIFSLVERGGEVRSFHVNRVNARTLKPIMLEQVARDAHLMTDEFPMYKAVAKEFASHTTVNHKLGEFSRKKDRASTNTVEGYFSILKRGLIGTFHHVGPQHLKRYIKEFDFRYNHRIALGFNDQERSDIMLKRIRGKRLLYKGARQQPAPGRSTH